MPCIECENSLWRWGETGGCRYESLSQCEEDNADFYNSDIDYSFHFTHTILKKNMKKNMKLKKMR